MGVSTVKLGDEDQDDEAFAGLPELKFDDIIDIAMKSYCKTD